MKKGRKKTLMIIALVSIVLCGCPGCTLLLEGYRYFPGALGSSQTFEGALRDLAAGFANGGWLVCVSGFLMLIPFILVIIAVAARSKEQDLEPLEPTGASKEEPIPPTS